jgi:hypothetical protein
MRTNRGDDAKRQGSDDRRPAEARELVLRVDEPRQSQHDHDQQRDQVRPQPIADQPRAHGEHQAEDEEDRQGDAETIAFWGQGSRGASGAPRHAH